MPARTRAGRHWRARLLREETGERRGTGLDQKLDEEVGILGLAGEGSNVADKLGKADFDGAVVLAEVAEHLGQQRVFTLEEPVQEGVEVLAARHCLGVARVCREVDGQCDQRLLHELLCTCDRCDQDECRKSERPSAASQRDVARERRRQHSRVPSVHAAPLYRESRRACWSDISLYLFIYPSIHPSICLSIYLCIHISICLSLYLSMFLRASDAMRKGQCCICVRGVMRRCTKAGEIEHWACTYKAAVMYIRLIHIRVHIQQACTYKAGVSIRLVHIHIHGMMRKCTKADARGTRCYMCMCMCMCMRMCMCVY